MGLRAIALAAAAASLAYVSFGDGASARHQPLAVGYTTPAALAAARAAHPAGVLRSLPALRVAEVRPSGDAAAFGRALRARPGIRYVDAVSARRTADEPGLAVAPTGVAYEWQYAAARENAVSPAVLR
ncbi:MAG: S8 family serine peptidase, partial [Gaiellaceae bacterium]